MYTSVCTSAVGVGSVFNEPRITWPNVKPGDDVDLDALEVEIDWTTYDAAIERAQNKYHFSTFIVHIPGIRWETVRDGIEDYEYLAMLKRLLAERGDRLSARKHAKYEALLEVPVAITADFVTFRKDPAPIEKRRRQVAQAIEALTTMPHE